MKPEYLPNPHIRPLHELMHLTMMLGTHVGYRIDYCVDEPRLVGLYVINYNRYRLDFDYENLAVATQQVIEEG